MSLHFLFPKAKSRSKRGGKTGSKIFLGLPNHVGMVPLLIGNCQQKNLKIVTTQIS